MDAVAVADVLGQLLVQIQGVGHWFIRIHTKNGLAAVDRKKYRDERCEHFIAGSLQKQRMEAKIRFQKLCSRVVLRVLLCARFCARF